LHAINGLYKGISRLIQRRSPQPRSRCARDHQSRRDDMQLLLIDSERDDVLMMDSAFIDSHCIDMQSAPRGMTAA
jgi:hypothetical protein